MLFNLVILCVPIQVTYFTFSGEKTKNTAVGIRHVDHVLSLSAKVGNHFADKWRSLARSVQFARGLGP
jgi:hypothetical protein